MFWKVSLHIVTGFGSRLGRRRWSLLFAKASSFVTFVLRSMMKQAGTSMKKAAPHVGHRVSASATPKPPVTPLPVTPKSATPKPPVTPLPVTPTRSSLGEEEKDEKIEQLQREVQQLRNHLAKKDQELSDLQVEAQRYKLIKRESTKMAHELHKKSALLQEEQDHLKEYKAQVEHYKAQAAQVEQYKIHVEQLKRAAVDANALNSALKEVKAHEAELESEVQQNRATIDELRAKIEQMLQESKDSKESNDLKAQNGSHSSPSKSPASSVATAATARPAKNLRMAPVGGSADLTPEKTIRFTEAPVTSSGGSQAIKSREEETVTGPAHEPELFSTHNTNSSQARVKQVGVEC